MDIYARKYLVEERADDFFNLVPLTWSLTAPFVLSFLLQEYNKIQWKRTVCLEKEFLSTLTKFQALLLLKRRVIYKILDCRFEEHKSEDEH